MAGKDINQSSSPPIAPPEAPQMVSSVKLLILKKGEYILWTMKMEQYLAHTDYALWEVILNRNGKVQMTKDKAGNKVEVPPITAQQILARTRERKAKSILLMAIPDEHLARFHGIKDAKTLWATIKTRFGEGLDKGYDRLQRLLICLKFMEHVMYMFINLLGLMKVTDISQLSLECLKFLIDKGDLKTLMESSEDHKIWRNQQDWKLLSWKLYETCGVHTLMLDDSLVFINMFLEKRYPLTKEILEKMLSWRLEAEIESTLALDLIKFIKLQIEEK
uniref:Ribonuclease H-like domain-containing protein n=1 Tax=Tanacetum cinerariifolium TaxID=118510 RepID=A0A699IAN4_TANCI|nr:ribonuclease H-like domain-containing protein [Tanacetum cinerariifolium]